MKTLSIVVAALLVQTCVSSAWAQTANVVKSDAKPGLKADETLGTVTPEAAKSTAPAEIIGPPVKVTAESKAAGDLKQAEPNQQEAARTLKESDDAMGMYHFKRANNRFGWNAPFLVTPEPAPGDEGVPSGSESFSPASLNK